MQQDEFPLPTVTQLKNLATMLPTMMPSELEAHLVEISLISQYNSDVDNFIIKRMDTTVEFLKHRYLLTSLLTIPKGDVVKEQILKITHNYESAFVNCRNATVDPSEKNKRAAILESLSTISTHLTHLSQAAFQEQEPGKRQQLLIESIEAINQMLKDTEHFPENCLYMLFGGQVKKCYSINPEFSFCIKTKNRCPLVLDMGFGRFLFKIDDQLAHEVISMHIVKYLNNILIADRSKQSNSETGLPAKIYPPITSYQIILQPQGAFYELVQNAKTIDQIKVKHGSIIDYMESQIQDKQAFRRRFSQSLAGFAFCQYILQLRDRNNCNIMLSQDGTIFHIDYAFIFESKPGGIALQSAPFKLTEEYRKLMGGFNSPHFKTFQSLLCSYFSILAPFQVQLFDKLFYLSARWKYIKCFKGFSFENYKKRFPKQNAQRNKITQFVQQLIIESNNNAGNKIYDSYQRKTNGIAA